MSLCLKQIACCYPVTLSSPNGLSARKAGYPMYFSNPRTDRFTRKRATPGDLIPPFFFRLRDVRESYCPVMTSLSCRHRPYYLWACVSLVTTTCRHPMQLCCAIFYQFLFLLSRVNLLHPGIPAHTRKIQVGSTCRPGHSAVPSRGNHRLHPPTTHRSFRRIVVVSCQKPFGRYSGL